MEAVTQPTPIGWRPDLTFGDRLRAARKAYGRRLGKTRYGQAEFAAVIEVGQKALGAWEAGINEPPHLAALASHIEQRTGIDREWLLGQEAADGPPDQGIPTSQAMYELAAFRSRKAAQGSRRAMDPTTSRRQAA